MDHWSSRQQCALNEDQARRAAAEQLLAHDAQRLADQARHVHLREPDALGDLRLRQPLLEAHAQDLALARGQPVERGLERGAVLRALELLVLAADRLERVELLLAAPGRSRARRWSTPSPTSIASSTSSGVVFSSSAISAMLGERPSRPVRRSMAPGHRRVQLLERARHADRPALVAEVALDLADDVRRGVGGERDLALELEAVDRLDQADRAHLLDVLERLAAAGVAARERAHQRQVALDQLLARRRVAALVVAAQQLAVLLRAPSRARTSGAVALTHGPLSFSSRTTMPPSPTSSTPKESTTVWRMRCSVSCAGARVAVAERLGHRGLAERPDARADAVAADLEREPHAALRARLGQQPLDGELKVVDLLEGEVHALGDAADDQPHDGLEVARDSGASRSMRSCGSRSTLTRWLPDRSVADDAVADQQAGELARAPRRARARRARARHARPVVEQRGRGAAAER